MIKLFYSSLLTLVILGVFNTAPAKMSIAVNQFNARGVDSHEAELIAARIRSRLVRSAEFQLLERAEMETILKEQGFQKSGICSDQSCVVEIGQVLGVKKMISGSAGKIGRMYTIAIRAIDVATGKIEFSTEENCRCPIEDVYTKSTEALAEKLIKYYQNPSAPLPLAEKPKTNRRRNKIIRQIALGTAAVGLTVGGIVYESKVRSTNNDMRQNLPDDQQKKLYDRNQSNERVRNLFFIGSGISVVGFGVLFFF